MSNATAHRTPATPSRRVPLAATARIVPPQNARRRVLASWYEEARAPTSPHPGTLIHRGQLVRVRRDVEEVLDTTAERHSLAYAAQAGRLYWTGGGQPRSAPLR